MTIRWASQSGSRPFSRSSHSAKKSTNSGYSSQGRRTGRIQFLSGSLPQPCRKGHPLLPGSTFQEGLLFLTQDQMDASRHEYTLNMCMCKINILALRGESMVGEAAEVQAAWGAMASSNGNPIESRAGIKEGGGPSLYPAPPSRARVSNHGTRQMGDSARQELKKDIRLHHATAMVVGIIIGASIFVQPSEITGPVPSLSGAALVWLAAGVLTFFGALVAAELASTFPESGGVYAYLREAFSPLVGFLWGWAMFWTMHTGIIAAIAMVFARYLAYFLPLGDMGIKLAAVAAILLLSWVNYLGVKQGSNLQTAFTAAKVLAILLMIGVGFALGTPAESVSRASRRLRHGYSSTQRSQAAAVRPPGRGLPPGLPHCTGGGPLRLRRMAHGDLQRRGDRRTRKTIPRALTIGRPDCHRLLHRPERRLLLCPSPGDGHQLRTGRGRCRRCRGGAREALSCPALVVFSTFGAISGIILAGPRVYFAMARDGLLFRWLGAVHPTRGVPHRAIWLQGIWACFLVLTGTYRALFTRVVYTEWIFFGLMAVGLFLFRRRPGVEAGAIPPGAIPLVPAVFAFSAFAIVINQVVADPVESSLGLGFRAPGRTGLLCLGSKRISSRRQQDDHRFPQPLLSPRVHRRRPERAQATSPSRTTKRGTPSSTLPGTTTWWSRGTETSSTGPGFWTKPAWTCRSSPSPAPAPSIEPPDRAAYLASLVNDALAKIVKDGAATVHRPGPPAHARIPTAAVSGSRAGPRPNSGSEASCPSETPTAYPWPTSGTGPCSRLSTNTKRWSTSTPPTPWGWRP